MDAYPSGVCEVAYPPNFAGVDKRLNTFTGFEFPTANSAEGNREWFGFAFCVCYEYVDSHYAAKDGSSVMIINGVVSTSPVGAKSSSVIGSMAAAVLVS